MQVNNTQMQVNDLCKNLMFDVMHVGVLAGHAANFDRQC